MSERFAETERNLAISISASGDNIVIPAPSATQALYIDHINLVPTSAVNLTLKDGASTNLTGAYSLTSNQGYTMENSVGLEHGLFECGYGNAFIINLSAAIQVSGYVRYRIVNE